MHLRLYRRVETHQKIDRALREELRHRWQNPIRVMRLKKRKLRVKDLMHKFTLRLGRA